MQMSQLVIKIPRELHLELKIYAARRNMTLKRYFIVIAMEALKKEKKYNASTQ